MTDPRDRRSSADPGAPHPGQTAGTDARRRRTTGRVVAVAAGALVLVGAVVAGAVGLDDARDPVPAEPSSTPVTTANPTATDTATATATPDPAPTTAPTVAPTPSPGPTAPPEPAPTPSSGPPPSAGPPALPPQATGIEHGSRVWAVYVAVMESTGDPRWTEAGTALESLGYTASGGELACDQGAAEALGLDPQLLARGAYFATEADAMLFADLYEGEVVGVVQVTVGCLD